MLNNIYLIMGASGSGKSKIAEALEKEYGLTAVPSYTTRQPRRADESGHIFVSKEEFDKLDLVAYTYYDNNHYGATNEQIAEYDLFINNPDGIKYFLTHYNGKKKPIVIYINSPLTVRMYRMELDRGFNSALERIKKDIIEFKDAEQLADKVFTNEENTKLSDLIIEVYDYIADCETFNKHI